MDEKEIPLPKKRLSMAQVRIAQNSEEGLDVSQVHDNNQQMLHKIAHYRSQLREVCKNQLFGLI
tara:strand:- start:5023 stop:5214 length:192 start_codon:yes stop_codon:yes gene_type:complete